MQANNTHFDPASVSFQPVDESTPLSRLLAALEALVAEYPAGRVIRGDREGREVPAAKWAIAKAGSVIGFMADFDVDEFAAYDFRDHAAALLADSGLDGETEIKAYRSRYSVSVILDAEAL